MIGALPPESGQVSKVGKGRKTADDAELIRGFLHGRPDFGQNSRSYALNYQSALSNRAAIDT